MVNNSGEMSENGKDAGNDNQRLHSRSPARRDLSSDRTLTSSHAENGNDGQYDDYSSNRVGSNRNDFREARGGRYGRYDRSTRHEGYSRGGHGRKYARDAADRYSSRYRSNSGYGREDYGREDYNSEGYGREGYDREGYGREGYGREGYGREGYGRESYGREGYGREDYGRDDFRGHRDQTPRERGPVVLRDLDSPYHEKMNRNYANSIFVGNLTYDCQPPDLEEYFGQVGEVIRADIITSRGHHRGMGTVEFTNSDDVSEAIRRCDGASFLGRDIFVRQDNPPPESLRKEREPIREMRRDRFQPGFEVFVANLPFIINWQALKDMFKECGVPTRADVKLDRDGRSRGFGTVYFETIEEAHAAIERFNGYELDGRILEVKEGQGSYSKSDRYSNLDQAQPKTNEIESPRAEGKKANAINVDNLPLSTAQSDLFDLFETIGKVIKAEMQYHEDNGSAYIEYENEEDAEICIQRLDKYTYGGHELAISYAEKP